MVVEAADPHLLRRLVFPARYEALSSRLGPEVARLLVPPGDSTVAVLEKIGLSVSNRSEGLLVPAYGPSGTGKTTLANNVTTFLPRDFAPTVVHTGDVSFDALLTAVQQGTQALAADDQRTIPVNVDHRESAPPSSAELSSMKRFLREATLGHRAAIFWPETSEDIAGRIASSYREIVGTPPLDLPLVVEGPDIETWVDIGAKTLELSNDLTSLESVGVDPRDYEPSEFPSLGAFLSRISTDFVNSVHGLIASTQKTLRLVVVFVSESLNAGVLSQLTSSAHYGLVDGRALVAATSQSEVGRYWAERPGLLTQTIVRLDCRAVCLPPPASVRILRRFGPEHVRDMLEAVGVGRPGQELVDSVDRSDLGRLLSGTTRPTFEARGTPATTTTPAFQLLASEYGFTYGKDKELNRAIRDGLEYFLGEKEEEFGELLTESGRDCPRLG